MAGGGKDWLVCPAFPALLSTPAHHSPFVPNIQHCSLPPTFATVHRTTHALQWHMRCTLHKKFNLLYSRKCTVCFVFYKICTTLPSLTPSQTLLCEADKEKQTNTDTDIDTDQYCAVLYKYRWRYWYRYRDTRGGAGGSMPRYLWHPTSPSPHPSFLSATIVGYANDFHPIHGLSLSAFHGTFE